MPLSEDEQRILSEIEQHLYESDPALAREVSQTTVYTHAFRNLKWGVVGFVVGIIFLIFTLSTSYWLSFVGFLVMLGSSLVVERNLRRLGRAGLDQMTRSMRGGGLRDVMGGAGARVRERFNRQDDQFDQD